jgi:UDP-glucose 6-dehydrogenase
MQIGIIGYGWIGKATHKLFPNAQIYDKYQTNFNKPLENCDLAFLAVPTPWTGGPELDCSAVEDAIANCGCDFIVIRSATQPGFADRMIKKYNKRICVQPEYLGETPNHPFLQMDARQFMVIGGDSKDRRKVIECYQKAYNANVRIRQVTNLEAEIIKFSENRAIFYKVMQCQELYDACEAAGVDYYVIREAVYGDDPRMNLWWTFVFPENRGANSKCIPKDIYAWCAWAESVGINPIATKNLLKYNEKLIKGNTSNG